MYWAEALAAQDKDAELKILVLSQEFKTNEAT
jgi:monomeric isocitrate dehydrogenase